MRPRQASSSIQYYKKFCILFARFLHPRLYNMSRASKLTLAGTAASAVGIVILVHYQQQAEKIVRSYIAIDL